MTLALNTRMIPGLLFLASLFLSCSDDPNILNSLDTRFTDADIEVIVDTLEATSGSSFRQYIPTNGDFNLVGLSGADEARMAMQFTAGFLQRDTVEVLSATLRLRGIHGSVIPPGWSALMFTRS